MEAPAVELSSVQSNWKFEGVFYKYKQRLVLKKSKASIYYCLSLDVRHLIAQSIRHNECLEKYHENLSNNVGTVKDSLS